MNEKQKNVWSTDETSNDGHRLENTKPTRPSSMELCVQCCLVSSLLTGIILATIIALWLTSSPSNKTTTTTVLQSIFNTSKFLFKLKQPLLLLLLLQQLQQL